jgi:hypothetical protein
VAVTEPTDHLAGKTGNIIELIKQLPDEQLAEQRAFWEAKVEHYRSQSMIEEGSMFRRPSYAAHRFGRWVGMAVGEQVYRQQVRQHHG